ncbi:MAG: pantothenate kinase [Cyanobacteria bacterium RYN_339]|nr:pantothenate kinase [Cyanobacteria bacterium RYN_339]
MVNVGNTATRLARFEGDRLVDDYRVPTGGTPPELDGAPIAIVSVVPEAARALAEAWGAVAELTAEDATGMAIAYEPPQALGIDRLANAYALFKHFGKGIAVDFGTATTITVVDQAGVLAGGAIMPGLSTAMASLKRGTAQLPEVPVEATEALWGRSTRESIQIGVVHGQAGAIRHLIGRMPGDMPVVITGGWAGLMAGLLPATYRHEPAWTLEGGRLLYHCSTRH